MHLYVYGYTLIQVFPSGSIQLLRCRCSVPLKEAEEMRYIKKEWLAGEMAQQNSSFLSGAVIKPASKNNLGEERIHIT